MPQQQPDHWAPVIAGSFAILGVLVAQGISMLSAWRERKHRRAAILLQKLEELTAADCETLAWLTTFQASTNLQQAVSAPPSIPCYRLSSLALLYFPRLRPAVAEYTSALVSYFGWACRRIRDDVQQPLGAQLRVFEETESQDRDKTIRQLRQTLLSALEREVQAYLNES